MAVVLNKNDIIQEAYELYTRLILLQQPPFILQNNNKYKVLTETVSNIGYSILYLNDEYDSSIVFDIDSLFFLSDGYIVSFSKGDFSQSKLYVLSENFKECALVSIADYILIPPLLEKHKKGYVELGDLNKYDGKVIKNFSGSNIKFSSGAISTFYNIFGSIEDNKNGKLNKLFYFDELILDNSKSVELINAMHIGLNVDTLYISNNLYWNIDFRNICVNKIIISDGTIGISFSDLHCSLDVVLPKSIKYIGQMSFNRSSLNSINLEDLEDVYIGDAAFQSTIFNKDKREMLDLSKCIYLGVEAFKSSKIKNVKVADTTVIDTNCFSKSELESFKVVNIDRNKQVLYDEKICNDYKVNLNDIILEDNLHKLTYYNSLSDTYIINKELFIFCDYLSNIYIPCKKVIFKSKSISFVSPTLKISGMKEYTIEDIYNTLLCKKWVIIDNHVFDYVDEFMDKYIDDDYTLYRIYNMLVCEGYIGHLFDEMDLKSITNVIVDILIDYIFNLLSNYMEEDYYEYNGNIPYLNLRLIGKKSRPEINLKNLVFDILSDWSRGYQYNEKKEFITNRNCNANATVWL